MKTAQRHVALLILPVPCSCLVLTVAGGNVQAADAVHPVKMSAEQIAGRIFEDYKPLVSTHNGNTTHDVEVFRTASGLFDAGMYRSSKVSAEISKPYGVNEYMHFIEGVVTLTSGELAHIYVDGVSQGYSLLYGACWRALKALGYVRAVL